MAESGETIDVKVLIVSRRRFALEAEEKRALYCWADRLGGTTAGNSGFETEASLMLKLLILQQCGGGEVHRSRWGKPFVVDQPFRWSLSHDRALACVAMSPAPVGIDVEQIVPLSEAHLAALDHAAPEALGRWVRQSATRRQSMLRFALAWTATEAALKASGEGFAVKGALSEEDFRSWRYESKMAEGCLITCACSQLPRLSLQFVGREHLARALGAMA